MKYVSVTFKYRVYRKFMIPGTGSQVCTGNFGQIHQF